MSNQKDINPRYIYLSTTYSYISNHCTRKVGYTTPGRYKCTPKHQGSKSNNISLGNW